jgi:hypothetical protein
VQGKGLQSLHKSLKKDLFKFYITLNNFYRNKKFIKMATKKEKIIGPRADSNPRPKFFKSGAL